VSLEKYNHIVDSAMIGWKSSDQGLLLHMVFRDWQHVIMAEREVAAQAIHMYQQNLVHQACARHVEFVMCQMENGWTTMHVEILFRAWTDLISHAKASMAMLRVTAKATRLEQLHRVGIQKLLFQCSSAMNSTCTHVCFSTWKAAYKEAQSQDQMRTHLCKAGEQHTDIMAKTLLQWGKNDQSNCMSCVLSTWRSHVEAEREIALHAANLAQRRALTEIYERQVSTVLLRMNADDEMLQVKLHFEAWHDCIEDVRQSEVISGIASRAEEIRMIHRSDVQKLLHRLAAFQDITMLSVVIGCWTQTVVEGRKQVEISRVRAEAAILEGEQHDKIMEKNLEKMV
jgi:hypothetical protein